MSEPRVRFQQLLRELFQFDLADLDFGIYRIMNHKRQVIERWITEDLPKDIEKELQQGALAEQQQAQQALADLRQKVLDTLGEEAIDAEGNLAEAYQNTKVGGATTTTAGPTWFTAVPPAKDVKWPSSGARPRIGRRRTTGATPPS